MRRVGELRCRRSQWRLLACVSLLRTTVTRVIPLCGSAGWWVALACLLPGAAAYTLGRLGLKRRGCSVLHGSPLVCLLAAACLLEEGTSSLTALGALFTEGAGTPGTPFTLALVASGMLLFGLNRQGLARGVYLLRWPLLAALALVAAGYGAKARVDHLFPLLGGGEADVVSAICSGMGMGWVFLLALMEEPPVRRRMEILPPICLCGVCALCLCLCIPHEVLATRQTLGDTLVQTVAHLAPLGRLTCLCLWVSGLFLSLGSACSLGASHLLAPWGREVPWLSGALALLLAATQLVDTRSLWQALNQVEPWLLGALVLGAGACWRKR